MKDIVKKVHQIGHAGQSGTYNFVRNTLGHKIPLGLVKDVVSNCVTCQKYTRHKTVYLPTGQIKLASSPGEELHCDTLILKKSPNGYTGILIIVDSFTSFCQLVPIRTNNALESVMALVNWIATFGLCCTIRTDQGVEFNNLLYSSLCDTLWIKHLFSMVGVKTANGLAEVTCKSVLDGILKKCSELGDTNADNWDAHIEAVQFALNNRILTRTGVSPHTMMFGRNQFARKVEMTVEHNGKLVKVHELPEKDQYEFYMKQWKFWVESVWPQAAKVIESYKVDTDENDNKNKRINSGYIQDGDYCMFALRGSSRHRSKMQVRYIGPLLVKIEKDKPNKMILIDKNGIALIETSMNKLKRVQISSRELLFDSKDPNTLDELYLMQESQELEDAMDDTYEEPASEVEEKRPRRKMKRKTQKSSEKSSNNLNKSTKDKVETNEEEDTKSSEKSSNNLNKSTRDKVETIPDDLNKSAKDKISQNKELKIVTDKKRKSATKPKSNKKAKM